MDFTMPAPGPESGTPDARGGLTILEAYSALAKRQGATCAVEIPFPGHPDEMDPERSFWQVRIREAG